MLNLNFNKRVVLSTDDMPWQPSGLDGVYIKSLAIEDSETGHLTALVKYSADAIFSRKERSHGEEMLILQGSFRGQHGDYKTGTYYRSPPNNEQLPLSQQGCIIFLKLNQFDKNDTEKVMVNINEGEWTELDNQVKVQFLHKTKSQQSLIYQWKKGTEISSPSGLTGGAEVFVLKGNIKDRLGEYAAGTWLRSPDQLFDQGKAMVDSAAFIKYGHFPKELK